MESMDHNDMYDEHPQPQNDEIIENMEEKLEHLEDFDNATQLELLYYEIDHIIMHGIQPNETWYNDRMNIIESYHNIDWKDLATRSYQLDDKMYESAINIIDHLEQLEDEWSTCPTFNLCVYQRLLEMIRLVWKYYAREYYVMDKTETVDILDLMNSMDNI